MPEQVDDAPRYRQMTDLESASYCDFAAMDDAWHSTVDGLVEAWVPIQEAQRQYIVTAVQEAVEADDIDRLNTLEVPTTDGANLLFGRMQKYAQGAGAAQQREAEAQGVAVPEWSLDDEALTAAGIRDRLRQVASATARLLGVGLVQSAVRRAVQLFGSGTGEEIAEQVDEHLAGLSDASVRDAMGSAITTAQNEGRLAVLNVAPQATYVSTEILDGSTCLAPEVLVTTRDGLVPAKDVILDDQLLTHAGRWVKPSRIIVSYVEEELIRVHIGEGRSVRLTWDHPVLVRSDSGFSWRKAGDLTVGDLVVDQSTLQLGGEPVALDVVLGQAPHDVSAGGEIGRLPSVDMGAEGVPVGSVSFDDELITDEEVGHPGADLGLCSVAVAEGFQYFSDAPLNAGFRTTGEVAALAAVPPSGLLGGTNAESVSAVLAVDQDGRPSAGFGAVLSAAGEPLAESCSASHAVGGYASCIQAACQGAVVVPGGVGDRDAELGFAVRADLADSVSGRAQLGAQLRVGELALLRAVHGAHPLPPSDLSATQLAGRRREVRVLSQPSGLARAALAERPTLDGSTASRTRLIHDLSVQVGDPNFLVVVGVDREMYAGEVYDFTIPEDETFWAEGVLVHNCSPCREVDGTTYTSLAAVRAAYPSGGYVDCLGGSRCRGTFVTVWPQGGDQQAAGMILAASAGTIQHSESKGGGLMPYDVVQDHPDCAADMPWAVVKKTDNELMGCHETEASAERQRDALYAEEDDDMGDDHDDVVPLDYAGETAPWEGVLAVEGIVTGDGRQFAEGALTWADLPVPLRWNIEDSHGGEARTKAVNVGNIQQIWRDGNKIMGSGLLDLGDENGKRAFSKISGGFLRGVSIDADSIGDADVEMVWPEDANEGMTEEDDLFELLFAQPEKMIFHAGRIRAATLVDIPAFAEAYVALLDSSGAIVAGGQPVGEEAISHATPKESTSETQQAVTAAGVWQPPAEWFADPKLSLPTPITVTDEGRIYGHAAQWGSCHIGQEGACIQPPREAEHPYYRTGEVVCADGSRVAVGQITVGTGHAPLHLGAQPAAEHYDNTGAAVADVAVGNDEHGIWVAGFIRPSADPLRVYELQAAGQVSGDWRRIGGQLRLVGLLAVNVPGFPVPKMRARVASGQPQALLAAGRPTVGGGMSQAELERWATRVVMRMLSRQVHPGGR